MCFKSISRGKWSCSVLLMAGLFVLTSASGCRMAKGPSVADRLPSLREPPPPRLGQSKAAPATRPALETLTLPEPRPLTLAVAGTVEDLSAALEELGLRVVFGKELRRQVVRGRWEAVASDQVLAAIAVMLGDEVGVFPRPAGVVYVGPPVDRDLLAGVYDVPFGAASEWVGAYRLAGTGRGNAVPIGDRIVVRDTLGGMAGIAAMHDEVRRLRDQYVVEVTFFELTRRGAEALGLDWTLQGALSYGADLEGNAYGAAAELRAQVQAQAQAGQGRVMSSSRLILVEGSEASMQVGDSVPVPIRTTSPEGTVTTTGYQAVEAGVGLTINSRAVEGGRLRLMVKPEVSAITGYVEGIPVLSRRRFDVSCILGRGGVVVIGGVDDQSENVEDRGVPLFRLLTSRRADAATRRLYVMLQLRGTLEE